MKKEFENQNLVTCELRYEGCWVNNSLSFAHSRKRRNANTKELMREVILCCTPCHSKLEVLGETKMHRIVTEIIEKRICI